MDSVFVTWSYNNHQSLRASTSDRPHSKGHYLRPLALRQSLTLKMLSSCTSLPAPLSTGFFVLATLRRTAMKFVFAHWSYSNPSKLKVPNALHQVSRTAFHRIFCLGNR
jgi:hypothetical protein